MKRLVYPHHPPRHFHFQLIFCINLSCFSGSKSPSKSSATSSTEATVFFPLVAVIFSSFFLISAILRFLRRLSSSSFEVFQGLYALWQKHVVPSFVFFTAHRSFNVTGKCLNLGTAFLFITEIVEPIRISAASSASSSSMSLR